MEIAHQTKMKYCSIVSSKKKQKNNVETKLSGKNIIRNNKGKILKRK
jgi:hypothetical protein